jgi:chorismate lyase/3-hydroxybenzoate synthase
VTGQKILTTPNSAADAARFAPVPPAWAVELAKQFPNNFAVNSVRIPQINAVDGKGLERVVADAYCELLNGLRPACPHPVRIWNFLSRILHDGGDGLDRYMRFNVGRYHAFKRFFGGTAGFDKVVPAASAVGHDGDEFIIHALCSRTGGEPIANPRQRAPYRYSDRFGPLPPCFARAMRVEHQSRKLLMIGGTASVRGEDSVHIGNLPAQLEETAQNLSALISAAFSTDNPLARLTNLRVYYVRSRDLPEIRTAVSKWFRGPVEWFQADLCRSDLLVEIEGLAELTTVP